MTSCYRLGDLIVCNHLSESDMDAILKEHPNSLGSKYILHKRNNILKENIDRIDFRIDIITKLVLDHIEQNLELLPKNITDSTVIHLRLGDVMCGNAWHEKAKRPLTVDHLKSSVANNNNPKYVIGKCHFGRQGQHPNYEESVKLSAQYLDNVTNELEATHFNSGDPDIDLCCAVKSKLFIQGRDVYSELIGEIRKKLNLECIKTESHFYG